MMYQQLNIEQLTLEVAQTYERIQELYLCNVYSQYIDDEIEIIKIKYYNDLYTLKSMGVGGVLIRGYFRSTEVN